MYTSNSPAFRAEAQALSDIAVSIGGQEVIGCDELEGSDTNMGSDELEDIDTANIISFSRRTRQKSYDSPNSEDLALQPKATGRKARRKLRKAVLTTGVAPSTATPKIWRPIYAGILKPKTSVKNVFSPRVLQTLRHEAEATLFGGSIIIHSRESSILDAQNIYNQPDWRHAYRYFVIWTDASMGEDLSRPGGAAVVFKQHPYSTTWVEVGYLVYGCTTVNEMELAAIEQALSVAVQLYPQTAGQKVVKVFTDSTGALELIRYGQEKRKGRAAGLLKNIVRHTDELMKMDCQVELHWVKGHSGAGLNPMADEVAGRVRKAFIDVKKDTASITIYSLEKEETATRQWKMPAELERHQLEVQPLLDAEFQRKVALFREKQKWELD